MNNQYEYFAKMGLAELTNYFAQGQEESDNIEFKTGEADLDKIYRELCAFANTDGGVLIYGAPNEMTISDKSLPLKKEKRSVCKGTLCPSKLDKTPDSIIQKIMTAITPAIMGIKVSKITSGTDGFVYIIYVPQSINSPHQVNGTYYMRAGTMTIPAPHGIVQALFNKKKPAELICNLAVETAIKTDYYNDLKFQIHVGNRSRFPVHDVKGFIALIGDVREVNSKVFDTSVTPAQKWYLHKNLVCPSALVNKLWWSPHFENLLFHGDYIYMQLYLWAFETEAITKLYKIGISGVLEETDMSVETISSREVDEWNGHIKSEEKLQTL